MATVDAFASSLRHSMLQDAELKLAGLDKLIADDGYDWLDGYMSSIMDTKIRAPIAELIKTPSRTGGATAKKTRAAQAALTARAEKIKGLNARLGISPKKNLEATRAALSPLQSRDVNVFLSTPTATASSKPGRSLVSVKSPLGPKLQAPTAKPKKVKATAKAKKDVGRIESPIVITAEATPPPGTVQKAVTHLEIVELVVEPVVVKEATEVAEDAQNLDRLSVTPEPEPELALAPELEFHLAPAVEAKPEPVIERAPTPEAQVIELPVQTMQRPTVPELFAEPIAAADPAPANKADQEEEEDEKIELEADISLEVEEEEDEDMVQEADAGEREDVIQKDEVPESTKSQLEETPTPQSLAGEVPAHEVVKPASPAPAVIDLLVPLKDADTSPEPQPLLTRSTTTATAPPRNVRSSWLSKALTAGDSAGQRKSYAPGAHAALMGQAGDFGGLRKSLVPVGGLSSTSTAGTKRDSMDAALDLDRRAEVVRPEKITRVVHPSLHVDHTTTAFPLARSIASATSLPQAGIVPSTTATINSMDLSKSVSMADRPRSDIHKVTKALEDMREKAAAKARIAAATSSATKPTATSTGTGFLRGLSNLGMSLGMSLSGRVVEPLDAAAAAAAEAEEDARATAEAEAELAALMAQTAPKSAKKPTEFEPQPEALPIESPAIVSQTTFDQFFGTFGLDHPATERHPDQPVLMDQPSVSSGYSEDVVDLGADSEEEEMPLHNEAEEGVETDDEGVEMPDESTTPANTPPKAALQSKQTDRAQERPPIFKLMPTASKPVETASKQLEQMMPAKAVDLMEMEDELPELVEYPVENAVKLSHAKTSGASDRSSMAEYSVPASLNSSMASQAGMLNQSQASMVAGKVLGQKPATGSVKSVQAATSAAKKDQALRDRKNAQREAAEQRKQQAAQRKAEDEKRAAEEERKAKLAEQEARAKAKLEAERRRKEREERAAIIVKQKAAREKREAAAAAELAEAERIKKAEDEASRKRKMAPILSKSTTNPAAKRQAQGSGLTVSVSVKGKEPVRPAPAKTAGPLAKMGPSGFKPVPSGASSAPPATFLASQTTATATVSLVQQQAQQDRRPLGPPSRPSHQPQSHTTPLGPGRASTILQQSRTVLQAQLDQQAIAIQAQVDAVELPDIASEYSDSDDEERQDSFQRPQWAESPELRSALERQAHFNPDELFGPIKPLSMEELFKVRQGKFRSRTSSANWSGADRLTRTEEIEYAKRMGFAPLGQQLFRKSETSGSRPSGSGDGAQEER